MARTGILEELLPPETMALVKTGAIAAGSDFVADYALDMLTKNNPLSPNWRAAVKIALGVVLASAVPRRYAAVGQAAAIGLVTTGVLTLLRSQLSSTPMRGLSAYATYDLQEPATPTVGAYATSPIVEETATVGKIGKYNWR
ncbi:MAG: hypothetical protein V2G41_09910 [bacterium JZ-2024 1]